MPPLTPQLHAIIGAFLRERLGLHYGIDDRALLEDRLSTRAQDVGFESLLDYYYHLRYDDPHGAELATLADVLVVNESYFFREHEQLDVVARAVVAPLAHRGERARIWSAACAAGEEPLSLAMLLEARGLLASTEIVASDLSRRALARAAERRWTPRALRTTPWPALAARFLVADGQGVRLVEPIDRAITWLRLNLLDPASYAGLGPFDAILCRNVLIYFDDDTVRRVVAALTERLVPGGRLFVGVSESLLRFGTSLVCEEHDGVFCYRRPA
jgi:chemotaxis protein methyltransferase CheR